MDWKRPWGEGLVSVCEQEAQHDPVMCPESQIFCGLHQKKHDQHIRSDLEWNGLGWSQSYEPGNEEWAWEWGRREAMGSQMQYEKAGNQGCKAIFEGEYGDEQKMKDIPARIP